MAEYVIVGLIRKAHGIRGDLAIEVLTDSPDAIFASGRRVFAGTPDGDLAVPHRELHIQSVRTLGDGLLVHFDEIPDRTAAELWRARYLLVPNEEIPAPDESDVYLHELPGMTVQLEDGTVLGTIDAFYELPHSLGIDVRYAPPRESETVMLLYDDATIRDVDRERRIVVVSPPDGLLG